MPEAELTLRLTGRIPHRWALQALLVGLSVVGQHDLAEALLRRWPWQWRLDDGPWHPGGKVW